MNQKQIIDGPLDKLYPLEWFRNRTKSKKGPHQSSIHLARLIYKEFRPDTCIDLGAGSLAFANEMSNLVPGFSMAVEGSKFNKEFAQNGTVFKAHDLRKPLKVKDNFDLVTSWDVIEHIPAKYEKVIVKTVLNLAVKDVVLSIDSSKWGRYHVNCRPKGYWIKTFEAAGLVFQKKRTQEVAEKIFNDPLITSKWYSRNLLIFTRLPF